MWFAGHRGQCEWISSVSRRQAVGGSPHLPLSLQPQHTLCLASHTHSVGSSSPGLKVNQRVSLVFLGFFRAEWGVSRTRVGRAHLSHFYSPEVLTD